MSPSFASNREEWRNRVQSLTAARFVHGTPTRLEARLQAGQSLGEDGNESDVNESNS